MPGESEGMKDAEVRFYFDADILGLAHIVCGLRPDCTYPGDPGAVIKRQHRPPCGIQAKAKDREWIPAVGQMRWVAITRDSDIQSHLSLLQLVKQFELRLVTLKGADAKTPWDQLSILLSQWRNIESLVSRQGPIVIAATRTGFRHIDIEKSIERLRAGREAQQQQGERKPKSDTLF